MRIFVIHARDEFTGKDPLCGASGAYIRHQLIQSNRKRVTCPFCLDLLAKHGQEEKPLEVEEV